MEVMIIWAICNHWLPDVKEQVAGGSSSALVSPATVFRCPISPLNGYRHAWMQYPGRCCTLSWRTSAPPFPPILPEYCSWWLYQVLTLALPTQGEALQAAISTKPGRSLTAHRMPPTPDVSQCRSWVDCDGGGETGRDLLVADLSGSWFLWPRAPGLTCPLWPK